MASPPIVGTQVTGLFAKRVGIDSLKKISKRVVVVWCSPEGQLVPLTLQFCS